MKKKCIRLVISVFLISMMFLMVSCADRNMSDSQQTNNPSVVCITFPQYDWVLNIIGDNPGGIDVKLLNSTGVDMHSYQPAANDMISIADADLLIYTGGSSEAWIDEMLKASDTRSGAAFSLMSHMDVKEELVVEGMEEEKEAGSASEKEYDEHVWLSIKQASLFCEALCEEISDLDPANSKYYEDNLSTYLDVLNELDEKYANVVAQKSINSSPVVLFADRFPFRYLLDDYGISYYAAFPGCSAETEASFETVTFLSEKIDEYNLKNIIVLENSDERMAQTIIANSSQKDTGIVKMNSMQSITAENIASGVSYVSIMEDNLNALKEALK